MSLHSHLTHPRFASQARVFSTCVLAGALAFTSAGCSGTSEETDVRATASAVVGVTPVSPYDARYEQASAAAKEAGLLREMERTEYTTLPEWSGFEPLNLLGLAINPIRSMVRNFFAVTMERNSDVMPDGRKKGIHTYGSVATIRYEAAGNQSYTGLFAGVDHGLIRLSLAAKPKEKESTPGAAIKFLKDGVPSDNFMAMFSLDGQEGHNFFQNPFWNFVEEPKDGALKLLATAFATVSKDPKKVAVEFMAKTTQDGKQVAQPKGPVQLSLRPRRDKLRFREDAHEVREDIATIPVGTVLYDVYALGNDGERAIGRIVTTSRFIASSFGDEKLFFRHERIDSQDW